MFRPTSLTASIFRLGSISASSGFHTSAHVEVKQRYLRSVERVQKHFARMMQKQQTTEIDPVLGRKHIPFINRVKLRVAESNNQVEQLDGVNTSRLLYGAELAALVNVNGRERSTKLLAEAKKRETVNRIISLQNASQSESKQLAVKYAVDEFARFPGDTGSPEVQAAVSTIRIHYLVAHLKENKKNYPSLRKLEMMIQGRQRLLKYLKRKEPERYFWAIEKLGLTDEAVTNEFHLSRSYFAKVRFFGDRTLPLKLNHKEKAEQRRLDKLRKKAKRFLK